MSSVRLGAPGATRVCPHCKATVLASAAVCPGCRHHLRFTPGGTPETTVEGYNALSIDGTITHKSTSETCEYCVVLDIRNERGEQVVRHVVGVGVLQPGDMRRVSVAVELVPVRSSMSAAAAPKPLNPPPAPAGRTELHPPPAIKAPGVAPPVPGTIREDPRPRIRGKPLR